MGGRDLPGHGPRRNLVPAPLHGPRGPVPPRWDPPPAGEPALSLGVGPNVEDVLGRVRFLGFYLASGSPPPPPQTLLSLAQGSTYRGPLPAGRTCSPPSQSYFSIRIVHLPAGFFIGLWFVLQVFLAFGEESDRAWPSSPTWAGSSSDGW